MRTRGVQGGFSIAYDETSGIVTIAGHGFWTTAIIVDHFAALEKLVARVRARNRPVRVLLDLRTAPVQSAETSDVIREATRRIYTAEDRIAIVRISRLLDLQLKRAVENNPLQTFTTIEEAMDWLNGPTPPE